MIMLSVLAFLSLVASASSFTTCQTHHLSSHSSLQNILPSSTTRLGSSPDSGTDREQSSSVLTPLEKFRNASSEGFGTRARNVASTCQVGDIVVPLCGNIEKRQMLAARGVYPGVEYLICDLSNCEEGLPAKERIVTIRPAYPLRDHLERSDWPITIPLSEVPLWLSKTTYEAGTALGTLMLSGSLLVIAALLASIVRVAVIPSESMMPSLMPGDVVLVTRSIFPPRAGDVVFFDPPSSLDEAIANSKIGRAAAVSGTTVDGKPTTSIVSTKGKQFIKRVVGVPGEAVGVHNSNPYVAMCNENTNECKYRVDRSGQYSRPDVFPDESWNRGSPALHTNSVERKSVLGKNEFFVAGDNGYRSVDSRVWGPLNRKNIFGTAQFIVFPPSHAGRIPDGNIQVENVLE